MPLLDNLAGGDYSDPGPANPLPDISPSFSIVAPSSPGANLDPAFTNEYARVKNAGDNRSFDQWLFDHVTQTNDPNPEARAYLGLPADNLDTPTTPPTPSFVADFFGDPTPAQPDNSPAAGGGDLLSQFGNFVSSILGSQRPNVSTTLAPVSVTDNSVTVNGLTGGQLTSVFDSFFGRITSLLSVPAGSDPNLPNLVPLGYAQNYGQSTQRQGTQQVATVTGLSALSAGAAGTARTSRTGLWLALALVLLTGYLVYLQVKKK